MHILKLLMMGRILCLVGRIRITSGGSCGMGLGGTLLHVLFPGHFHHVVQGAAMGLGGRRRRRVHHGSIR